MAFQLLCLKKTKGIIKYRDNFTEEKNAFSISPVDIGSEDGGNIKTHFFQV